jgi:hypothetical protein
MGRPFMMPILFHLRFHCKEKQPKDEGISCLMPSFVSLADATRAQNSRLCSSIHDTEAVSCCI